MTVMTSFSFVFLSFFRFLIGIPSLEIGKVESESREGGIHRCGLAFGEHQAAF
jgi:hypothetical protein